jgi:hypothetical protein
MNTRRYLKTMRANYTILDCGFSGFEVEARHVAETFNKVIKTVSSEDIAPEIKKFFSDSAYRKLGKTFSQTLVEIKCQIFKIGNEISKMKEQLEKTLQSVATLSN